MALVTAGRTRRRPYYGWVVLVVGTIGAIASIPGQTAGVSVFTDRLTEATTLSRVDLSIAYLIGTGISGLALPRAGRILDRLGARVVASFAVVVLAVTLVGLSSIGPMGAVVGLVVMSLAFGSLRFSGQGLLTLSSRTMISLWFERRRGVVSAWSNAAVSFAFAVSPALLLVLVDAFGFRTAWRVMALVLVAGVGTMVVALYRRDPESAGVVLDGDRRRPTGASRPSPHAGVDRTRAEALRSRTFWAVTIPVVALASTSTALTFHILDLGDELGLADDRVVRIFLPVALVSVPVTFVGGWLVDRSAPVVVGVTMSVAQIAMYLAVPSLGDPAGVVVTVVAWGIAQGCYAPLTSAALAALFGRRHLGAIAGAQMSMMVIGSAVGPALFAIVEAATGSYRPAILGSLVVPVIGVLVATTVLGRRSATDDAPVLR